MKLLNTSLGGLLVAGFLMTGCGEKEGSSEALPPGALPPTASRDTVELVAEDLKKEIELFAVALRSGKDKATAEEAAVKIRAIAGRMKDYASRLAELDVPAEEVRKRLGKELREHERAIEERLGDAEDDLQAVGEAAEIVMKAVMEFGGKMEEASVVFDEYFAKEE